MKATLHLIMFNILWALPAAVCSEDLVVEPCFGENIAARKIAELPPEIKESIEDIFEDKLGDSDTKVLNTDYITPEAAKMPHYRFHQGYKFKDKYIVMMQFTLDGYLRHSLGYDIDKDGKYGIYPAPNYFFRGPACPILTAIHNQVTSRSDYPEWVRKAILDENEHKEKK